MALNNTYFETKKVYEPLPIPSDPGYVPPVVPAPDIPDPGSTPVIPTPSHSYDTTVTLYNNSSDNNVLNKNLSSVGSYNISVKDNMDLVRPEIVINGDVQCNYMNMLGRYYYCSCEALPGRLTRIKGKSDPLMSFKDGIKSQSAILERNTRHTNTYLSDPEQKITAYRTTHGLKFSGGFGNTLYYYLLTIGE